MFLCHTVRLLAQPLTPFCARFYLTIRPCFRYFSLIFYIICGKKLCIMYIDNKASCLVYSIHKEQAVAHLDFVCAGVSTTRSLYVYNDIGGAKSTTLTARSSRSSFEKTYFTKSSYGGLYPNVVSKSSSNKASIQQWTYISPYIRNAPSPSYR